MASTNWNYIGNDNLYAPGSTTAYKDVGVFLYKSQKVVNGSTVQVRFADHVKPFLEPYAGAHYYVHTAYSDVYSSASMTINLSDLSINGKKNGIRVRNGFLSLAIKTEGTKIRQCDIGLGNGIFVNELTGQTSADTGNRWTAFSWSSGNKPYSATNYNGPLIPLSATKAEIKITLRRSGNYDYLESTFLYKNNSNIIVGDAYITYRESAGGIFKLSPNGKPMCRFLRFMSLVPRGGATADDADGTYLNAKIRNLRLNNSTIWNKSKIDFAWSVQTANIRNLEISDLTWNIVGQDIDYINFIHDTQLH